MKRLAVGLGLGCALLLSAAAAHAALASELLGQPLRDQQGTPIGKLEDLIIDMRGGRVLYLIVEGEERFRTLPVRALGEDLRLDMSLAGETATVQASADPRFRRAAKLIGRPLVHPHPGDTQPIGTISDIEFDAASGQVKHVIVSTPEGRGHFAAGALDGYFPL